MTRERDTHPRRGQILVPSTLLLGGLLVAGFLTHADPSDRHETATREPINGAHEALAVWGASRSYPGRDIPADGFSRGYEYSVAELRRPLRETFGDGTRGELRRGQGTGWLPIGPTNGGGRTLTIAFDPNDPDIVYAGAASGGLWRSETGGVGAAAWERVPTGFPELGVSTVAFEPGNSDVFYIGTGEVYNFDKAGDLEADRRTRGSYGIGILKTTDGGATWSKSLDWSYNQQHGVWMIRVDPLDPSTVWAATTEGVFKSTDAGASWSQVLDVVMATDLVLHPNNPQVALAACGNLESADRGLYRTEDGGQTWTLITAGGLPTDFEGKMQFGVTPADPDLVYLSIGNGFLIGVDNFTWLFRSEDFGLNWSLRTTTDYSRWQGWFAHDVAVHPTDPDTVICIGIDIWRSTDGGLTLDQESDSGDRFEGPIPPGGAEGGPNYSHADHHDVIYHPTDPNIVYFANDGGVFRSLDGGQTFSGANGGYQSQQFYNGFASSPSDPNLAIGGLQDFSSAIYRGTPAWDRWVFGGDGGWAAIDADDPNTLYATSQRLNVGRSTNGGTFFFNISPPGLGESAFIAPLVMSPVDSDTLFGGTSFLYKTIDRGSSWETMNGGSELDGNPILALAIAQQNDQVVYAATSPFLDRGRVHRSIDGGASFVDVTGTLPDRFPGDLAVDPNDEATVYLAMSGFGTSHLFRSTDYGATWQDLDAGRLPDVPATAVAIDPDLPTHLYVGNDLGVYFTADLGSNWVQLDEGLPEAVLIGDLSVSPLNHKLRVATHGQGVYERDLFGLSLAIAGECPGLVDVSLLGATPNAGVTFVRGTMEGSTTVPGGSCAGTPLGLANPEILAVVTADGEGSVRVEREPPAALCGIVLQAIDNDSCAVSNVVVAP